MLAALLLACATLAADPLGPGDHAIDLKVDSRQRSYLVHVPPKYDRAKPWPVVLAFHGGGVNAASMVRFCGLNDKADQAGFLVVYPNGTGRLARVLTFNGGNCCGYAMSENVDDVAFTRQVLDDLAGRANVDAKRVFATGMSNGAILCYRLASELSDRIAAIAPVAGPMGTDACSPRRPVSVVHFHGTSDEFAPFAGGRGPRSLPTLDFYSVDHSIQAWVKADGCPEKPTTTDLPDKTDDGMQVQRIAYGPGQDESEVVLYKIAGGGHTWPGQEPRVEFLGKSTRDISANDLMWEFFENHPMK